MNPVYRLLQLATNTRSRRLKLAGIWAFHTAGRRYHGVYFDPVLACNLRCLMCYYSDEDKRRAYQGRFSQADVERLAEATFPEALKLQIGCAAEPTTYDRWIDIIRLGRHYGVPYIALTTNGQLISREQLQEAASAGLDEITLSAHGFSQQAYEHFMPHAQFSRFEALLRSVEEVKAAHPNLKLRINFTVNQDNCGELAKLFDVAGTAVDIVQVRPVQQLGQTAYHNFDLTPLIDRYEQIFTPLVEGCRERGITCIVPQKQNLLTIEGTNEGAVYDDTIKQLTHVYLSPTASGEADYDYHAETLRQYERRKHKGRQILRALVSGRPIATDGMKHMQYEVK